MLKFKQLATLLLIAMSVNLVAQQMAPIPLDPQIRYGKLENGLTYYIRHNEKPKQRAEFHIAQNVGSILELDDQDGLAGGCGHVSRHAARAARSHDDDVEISFSHHSSFLTCSRLG